MIINILLDFELYIFLPNFDWIIGKKIGKVYTNLYNVIGNMY
jgi:hypothetical protein